MARRLLVLFLGALVIVALFPVRAFLLKDREVIASTPSAYTGGIVPLAVPAHARTCANQVLFDSKSQIARFVAIAPRGDAAPAFEVEAQGTEPAGYAARAVVPGGWRGSRVIEARLRPPTRDAMGTFCVANSSDRAISVVGRNDDRTRSRPEVDVNGQRTDLELQLTLLRGGKRSLAGRFGEVLGHASTLRPLGVWWWWLLVLLVVAAVPALLALAIREATVVDRLDETPTRAPAPSPPSGTPWPSERTRRRVEAIPGWAIVAVVAALAVAYLGYCGLHTHAFQNDEDQYVYLSRWMQLHLPQSLWNFDVMQRGLQRLEVWLLAVPAALVDSPDSLAAGRLLNTLVFVSTAIPVYLIARRLGLSSRWAALPSALSVVVPWAVVTTAFLTENIAYPACLWIVWAIWRTAVDPAPGRDALALALLFVGGLSRTAMLLLVPLLPVVVLAQDLRFGTGSLRRRLVATLRVHAVLWGALGLGALVVVLGALGIGPSVVTKLAGVYGTPFRFDAVKLLFKIGQFFSRSVVGTGFFAAAIALPWLLAQLVRPADRARFAFAVTALGAGAIILYTVNSASFDERYIVYLAPLIFVPATIAIARREISPVGLAVASILLALLLLRVKWNPDQGDFGFFVSPAEMFYGRALAERLDVSVPGDRGTVLTLLPIALALAGVALAVTLRRSPGRLAGRTGAILIGAVVLSVIVQTRYTLAKYVNSAGSKAGPGLRARAFADEGTPSGARIGEFAEGAGKSADFTPVWKEVQFYNQRIDRVYSLGPNTNAVPPGDELIDNVSFDPQTGRLRASKPLPDYLVIPTPVGTARIRGVQLPSPRYIPAALIKVARPDMLAWSTSGLDAAGVVGPKGGGVRLYGQGLRPGAHCATIDLGAPATDAVSWSALVGGRRVGSGRLRPGALRRVTVALAQLAGRDHVDVTLGGRPRVLAVYVDQYC